MICGNSELSASGASRAAQYVTEQVIFKDPFIARGPCPDCGVDNRLFFGDVLGVEGNGLEGEIQCTNCKAALKVNRETLRVSSKPKKGKK